MWTNGQLKERGKASMKMNYWMTVAVSLVMMFVTAGASGGTAGSSGGDVADEVTDLFSGFSPEEVVGIVLAVFGMIMVAAIIALLIDIFVFNPLEMGCQYFFVENSRGKADFGCIGKGFNPWMRNVSALFLRDIFIVLWSLLFIIPGIIKGYSYRMVPYILAENPEMSAMDAITRSREMMNGNKMKAFMLDLSFIGWFLLSIVTCGILLIFYVQPYYNCTCAELYNVLKGEERVE